MDPGCGRSFPKGADFGDETLSSSREITVVKKQCAGWAAGSGGGGGGMGWAGSGGSLTPNSLLCQVWTS